MNRKNSCTFILKRGWLCALEHVLYLPYVDNIVVLERSSLLCWLPLYMYYSWYPCDFERNLVLSFIEHPQAEELGGADTTALHTRIQDWEIPRQLQLLLHSRIHFITRGKIIVNCTWFDHYLGWSIKGEWYHRG